METPQAHPRVIQGVCRRDLLKAGLALSVTLSPWSLQHPQVLWGAEAGQPKGRRTWRPASNAFLPFSGMWRNSSTMCICTAG